MGCTGVISRYGKAQKRRAINAHGYGGAEPGLAVALTKRILLEQARHDRARYTLTPIYAHE